MLAVVDDITELTNPVAKDNHTGLTGQLQVNLDVAMPVNELVNVGVVLYIALGIEH